MKVKDILKNTKADVKITILDNKLMKIAQGNKHNPCFDPYLDFDIVSSGFPSKNERVIQIDENLMHYFYGKKTGCKQQAVENLYFDSDFASSLGGRKIAFISLVGSQMYGLETSRSDYDFKVFVFPTYDDLYKNKMISKQIKYKGNDIDVKDIRKFAELLSKSSTPYIEAFYSNYKTGDEDYLKLFNNSNPDINIVGYFHALLGMAMMKQKAIEKDLPNSQENEGYKRKVKYGFDTKQLMHIARLSVIFERKYGDILNGADYHITADLFTPNKQEKEYLLGIKNNDKHLDKAGALELADIWINNIKVFVDNVDRMKIFHKQGTNLFRDKLAKLNYDKIRKQVKKEINEVK